MTIKTKKSPIRDCKKAIKNYKERLIRKAKNSGIWENLGREEVMILINIYNNHQYKNDGVWKSILKFENWCITLDDKKLRDFPGE